MKSYIIRLTEFETSVRIAETTYKTAQAHGWDVEYFDGFNGLKYSLEEFGLFQYIIDINDYPRDLSNHYKKTNKLHARPGHVGAILSHYHLWKKCVELDESICILEHDAIIEKPFPNVEFTDAIKLGSGRKGYPIIGDWYEGGYAYCVSPQGAQKLIDFVETYGTLPPDVLVCEDIVNLKFDETETVSRPPKDQSPSFTSDLRAHSKALKTYVIRLADFEASVRLANATYASAQQHGWDVEYFDGFNGLKYSLEDFGIKPYIIDINDYPRYLRSRYKKLNRKHDVPGVKGCFLSHYHLWKKCVELDESICILEHDASVNKPFPNVKFKDVIKLDTGTRGEYDVIGEWFAGAHAYCVTPAGAQKLIDFAETQGMLPVDVMICEAIVNLKFDKSGTVTRPERGLTPSFTSDIYVLSKVLKTYVIRLSSIDKSVELARTAYISALKKNWSVEYFEGYDGSAHTLQEHGLFPYSKKKKLKTLMDKPGVRGCFLSHYYLWKKCVYSGEPVCILEHDAIAQGRFPNIKFSEVIKLDTELTPTKNYIGEWFAGAHAYCVTPAGAQKLIYFAEEDGAVPVDVMLTDAIVDIQYSDANAVSRVHGTPSFTRDYLEITDELKDE